MNSQDYKKRIPAYFDGLLVEKERLELEAHLNVDADFARVFRQKQTEQNSLSSRIPQLEAEADVIESMESEVREAIDNLFKEDEAAAPGKRLKSWLQDLF